MSSIWQVMSSLRRAKLFQKHLSFICRGCTSGHPSNCWWYPRNSVHEVDPQHLNGQDKDLLVINVITSEPGHKREIYCTMEISGQPVKINIDTGAKCNMTTIDSFKKISCNEKIHLTMAVQLVAYGSAVACAVWLPVYPLSTLGTVSLKYICSQYPITSNFMSFTNQ